MLRGAKMLQYISERKEALAYTVRTLRDPDLEESSELLRFDIVEDVGAADGTLLELGVAARRVAARVHACNPEPCR